MKLIVYALRLEVANVPMEEAEMFKFIPTYKEALAEFDNAVEEMMTDRATAGTVILSRMTVTSMNQERFVAFLNHEIEWERDFDKIEDIAVYQPAKAA